MFQIFYSKICNICNKMTNISLLEYGVLLCVREQDDVAKQECQ